MNGGDHGGGHGHTPHPGGADPGPGLPPPAYPIAGYPGQPYAPAGYPVYPPGYPTGAFYPVGYGWAPVDPQPGAILGASILAYINSGLLILSGSLLLFGAAIIHGIDRATGFGTELAFDGMFNLIAGGLLIAGGVTLTGRRASGRVLLSSGNGVVLAECVYWLARFSNSDFSGRVVYVLLFGALAVVSAVLSWTPAVTAWLRRIPRQA